MKDLRRKAQCLLGSQTENVACLATFTVLTAILFRPITSLPHFFAIQGGDTFNNTWVWGRNLFNVLHGDSPFRPSMMFPDANSSFYSEAGLGDSVIYALGYGLFGSDVAGYATVFCASIILTGFFAYKIARIVGANALAALIAGLICAFHPYRIGHITHVQAIALFWALAPLYFMIAYLMEGSRRLWIFFLVALVPVLAGPSYNFVFFGFIVSLILALEWPRAIRDRVVRHRLIWIYAAFLIALIVTSPIWYEYIRLFLSGYTRTAEHNDLYKIDLAWLFIPNRDGSFYQGVFQLFESISAKGINAPASTIFPGYAILIPVLVAFVALTRNLKADTRATATQKNVLVACAVVAPLLLLISLGQIITWNGLYVAPNAVFQLVTLTPALAATRYIAHYAYLAFIPASIIVAWALSRWRPSWRYSVLVLLLGLAILIESKPELPIAARAQVSVAPMPKVYDFLATLPAYQGVVFLPFLFELTTHDSFHWQFQYMRYAYRHRLWMANGINGFFPDSYVNATRAFQNFPNPDAYRWILATDLRYIVLDRRAPEFARVRESEIGKDCAAFEKIYDDGAYAVISIDSNRLRLCPRAVGEIERRPRE
jgi:hypothetical protein